MEKRKEFWRALPFVMALLLLTRAGAERVGAVRQGKEEAKAVDGAPVAENMEIKVYRGVAYEGEFRAVDNEGDEMTFAIAREPKKGHGRADGGRPRICLHAGRQAGDGQLHLHGDRRLRQHLAARDGEHHNRKGK
ncbi:MAG: hypothetical protein ACLRSD_00380 [Oscillibacter sp.]